MTDLDKPIPTVTLDDLWDEMWEDLRRNATGRPSGREIVAKWRAVIEAAIIVAFAAETLSEDENG